MAAAAQSQPAPVLTLQAAVDRAISANPSIAASRAGRAVSLAGVNVARERPNPELGVEIEKETPRQAFGLSVPLELGGKRNARIAVAEAAVRSTEADLVATIAQVRNDVRRAYYDAVVADARRTLLGEIRDLAARVRDAAQARFDSGDVPRLEIVQAELALAAAENELQTGGSAVTAARARLNALLGDPLNAVPPLDVDFRAGNAVQLPAALDVAAANNAELAVLDRSIEEQRARITLAESMRVPDVTPSATLTHGAEPEFDYGWRAGLNLTLPVLTSHRAGVAVEQTTLTQLTTRRAAALARITGEVTAAASVAEAQRLALIRYRDVILPQAQQVEQMAQDAYQLGQTGIAALLQALQSSRDLRLRSLESAAQFESALADLERAIGAPLP